MIFEDQRKNFIFSMDLHICQRFWKIAHTDIVKFCSRPWKKWGKLLEDFLKRHWKLFICWNITNNFCTSSLYKPESSKNNIKRFFTKYMRTFQHFFFTKCTILSFCEAKMVYFAGCFTNSLYENWIRFGIWSLMSFLNVSRWRELKKPV